MVGPSLTPPQTPWTPQCHGHTHTHLKAEGLSTLESGSSKKWVWLTTPVVVSTVTTGKPICSVQRSMMVLMVLGKETLFSVTACGEGQWLRSPVWGGYG